MEQKTGELSLAVIEVELVLDGSTLSWLEGYCDQSRLTIGQVIQAMVSSSVRAEIASSIQMEESEK
jgi:hypothetical protein